MSLLITTYMDKFSYEKKSHLVIYQVKTYGHGGLDATKTQTHAKPYSVSICKTIPDQNLANTYPTAPIGSGLGQIPI